MVSQQYLDKISGGALMLLGLDEEDRVIGFMANEERLKEVGSEEGWEEPDPWPPKLLPQEQLPDLQVKRLKAHYADDGAPFVVRVFRIRPVVSLEFSLAI